jgi:putative membrane protein (TIGR04086 family)
MIRQASAIKHVNLGVARMKGMPGRIMWLAIAIGYLVDYLVSLFIRAISQTFDPLLGYQISFGSTAGIVTAVLLVLSTGLGGWVAGRLAKTEYVLHGVLVGGMGLIILLFTSLFGREPVPLLTTVLQCVAVIVGGIGGWASRWLPAPQQQ